jgi:beta-lactamase superfamily II metal-dependent hydrolase
VLSASQGESVILGLPGGGWGVIDCYASSLSDPTTNQTLNFLDERGIDTLEFLCLTHPHEDHFRGMSQILRAKEVRAFWHYAGVGPAGLYRRVREYLRKDASRGGDAATIEEAAELDTVHEMAESRGIHRPITGVTPLIPNAYDPDARFQVWALAPSHERVDDYQRRLGACFDPDRRLKRQIPHADHNIVSIALWVRFGQTQLLLGGDAEEASWRQVLERWNRLAVHAVKVSHHGSTNGYCEDLWESLGAHGRPFAIVTPYQRFRLPDPDALAHIALHAQPLVTCATALVPSVHIQIPPGTTEARLFARAAVRASSPPRHQTGRCSFVFDDAGNADWQCIPPAAAIV